MTLLLAVLAAVAQDGGSPYVPAGETGRLSPAPSALVARIHADAARLEQQGELAGAALRYREIVRVEPTWEQARLDLGRVLEAMGDSAAAERVYAAGIGERSLEQLARILMEQGRTAEAVDVLRRRSELLPASPGALVPYAGAQVADGRVREALETLRVYLDRPGIDIDADGALPVAMAVAEALLARMETEDASDLLNAVLVKDPSLHRAAVEELLVRIDVEDDAAALATAGEVPLDAAAIERLRDARADLYAGRIAEGRRRLEVLAVEHPRSSEVWATLAAARQTEGAIEGAEQALQVALTIDPLDAALHARLGDLLVAGYGGRRDLDAVRAYRKAVRHDANDAALWWRKARAERSAGEWEQAAVSASRAQALDPGAPFAKEAAAWVAGAQREDPPPVVLPSLAPDGPMPAEARTALARSQAWRERPEPYALDRALAEARLARQLAPDAEEPLHLEAAIHVDRGEIEEAVALFEESLSRDAAQPDVLVQLAPIYERSGRPDDAAETWERATALDHPAALWRRARAEVDTGHPWAARATLRRYFAATAGGVEYAAAQALDGALAARIRLAYVAGGALAVGVIAIPLWWVARSRGGRGLDGLLEASPSSWRDVARILSSIRHEILRHHGSSFGAVADALHAGDADAGRWLADQWFRDGAAIARFDGYVGELRELGRRAGVPLRLEAKDPVFGPLLSAVRRFAALRGPLQRGTRSNHTAAELRAIAAVLEGEVSPALGRTIARLCLLEIDDALLHTVVENVWREPALWDEAPWRPALSALPPGPLLVRMFRADLGDVLANLLRNAVEATRGLEGPRVGLAVAVDVDPVTGLERIEIRVRDSSPRRLSTSTVRGRFVGRGLGIAVDITTSAGGSITVEDEPGWGKAVVVRLPRAEPVEP